MYARSQGSVPWGPSGSSLAHGPVLYSLLFIALLTTAQASAPTSAAPVATAAFDFAAGYDWGGRVNQTHLVADALPLASVVDATEVTTPYIDLEITGLMPWRSYELTIGIRSHPVFSNSGGRGVAWSIPTESAAWTLVDLVSGEPVSEFVIHARLPAESGLFLCGPPGPVCPNPQTQVTYGPPQPRWTDALEDALAIEQGAYSFTPEVRVRTVECIDHDIRVHAKASGGQAAMPGTAGASYDYHTNVCVELNSLGKAVEYKGGVVLKRDFYADGSDKIYAIDDHQGFFLGEVDVNWQPPDQAFVGQIGALSEPSGIEWSERGAGGVDFGAGLKAYGVDLTVTMQASEGSSSKVRMEFLPPGNQDYLIWLVNGNVESLENGDKGIIGMVWKK